MIAARLAAAGMTASPDAIEHRSGFLAAFSPGGQPDLSNGLQAEKKEWQIERQGLNIKRYPSCYGTHRAIDAAVDLAIRHDLKPPDVAGVRVSTGEMQMLMLRNARPQTALEAKFSMQFAMASSLVARNVGLAQMRDDFVRSPPIQALIPRVSTTTTTETMKGSAFAAAERVEITTMGGKVFASEPIVYAKGSTQRPLSREELQTKFADCLGDGFSDGSKSRAFEKLMNLERLNSANDLLAL
jgi:2-methylcitrate dehydratase PrpD